MRLRRSARGAVSPWGGSPPRSTGPYRQHKKRAARRRRGV